MNEKRKLLENQEVNLFSILEFRVWRDDEQKFYIYD